MKFKHALFLIASAFTLSVYARHPGADSLARFIEDSQVQYKTLSVRARIGWTDGNEETSFQTGIRMRKDSIVWMSLSAGGIEGARLLINKDSIRVSEFGGIKSTHDLSYLQFWLPFPVNFYQLQQFISGQRIGIGEKAALMSEEDSVLVLHTESDKMRETVWVDKQGYTLRKILLKDKMLNQDMEIIFDAYAPLNGKRFSYRRLVTIHHGPASLQMTVEVSKATLNEELSYPFEK